MVTCGLDFGRGLRPNGPRFGCFVGFIFDGSDGSPEADVGCTGGDALGRASTRSGELGLSVGVLWGSGGSASAASPRSPGGATESLMALAGLARAGPTGGLLVRPSFLPTGAHGESTAEKGWWGRGPSRDTQGFSLD